MFFEKTYPHNLLSYPRKVNFVYEITLEGFFGYGGGISEHPQNPLPTFPYELESGSCVDEKSVENKGRVTVIVLSDSQGKDF